MKVKIAVGILFSGLLIMGLIYAVCYCVYIGSLVGSEAAAASRLSHLRDDLFEYRNKNRGWPSHMKQIGLDGLDPRDPMSNKPLLYFPDAKHGTEAILLAQPEPFRTRLWPFGEMKQWGVLANGHIVDLNNRQVKEDGSD